MEASLAAQRAEGMSALPEAPGCLGRKYCGGGFGGYAAYLFASTGERNAFLANQPATRPIEPYCHWNDAAPHREK